MTFEKWFKQNQQELPSWYSNPYDEVALKIAYEAGYNQCRNDWGGLSYGDPSNEFTNGLKR